MQQKFFFTSIHHKDTRFCVENPNWLKNYKSELDQIKYYESRNYKNLKFPPQIPPT